MSRRVTLVALWVVFAVASVSVGFAASSVVGDPFTDTGDTSAASGITGPGGDGSISDPDGTPTGQPTGTASPTQTSTPRGSTGPTKTPGATVKRGLPTKGGYVSATCRDGLVSVGAAPAVWWVVDSRTSGRVHKARVRFEPAKNANGERVEVTASCRAGIPVFTSVYSDGGGGGGGGDDSGGGSGSGGGGHGGGGSDDSSGSDGKSGSGGN